MPVALTQRRAGRGKFKIRAVIEGWPYIFVDDRSLVSTQSDGRQRIVGLISESVRFAARAELARAELSAQEMTLEFVDPKPRRLMTRALHATPQRRTWLTADISASDTTIPVADTAAYPDSSAAQSERVIHIGTEAIAYADKTATTFIGCTRGYWDSTAQAHTIGDAGEEWYPPVTDVPRELTGRRVVFFLYGTAENPAGAGSPRWRGICRGGVDFGEGRYSIAIDPITLVLEQQLGTDLEAEVPIRGAYFPSQAAMRFTVNRHSGATVGTSIAATFEVMLSDFFTDQFAVVDAINAQIAAQLGSFGLGTGAVLEAATTTGGYLFRYRTGSTPYYVSIVGAEVRPAGATGGPWPTGISPVDLFVDPDRSTARWRVADGPAPATLVAGEYTTEISAPMPRTWIWPLEGTHFRGPAGSPLGRIYLGGSLVPSADAMVLVASSEDSEPTPERVRAVDATDRWIEVDAVRYDGGSLGPDSTVKMVRLLATGDVGDLITALVTDSPGLAAYGAMPLITTADFPLDFTELRQAIGLLGLGASRRFFVSEGVSLGQLLAEELKLVGCYLALDSQGRLVIRRLRLATPTDASVRDVDSSKIKGSFPKMSASPDGILGQVLIKQRYDPIEGKHRGTPILVRNTTSPTRLAQTLTIAPLSRSTSAGARMEVDPEHAYQLASAVLGVFGESYEIVSMEAGLELDELAHGDTVLLTTEHLPGPDGTMGLTEKPAQVLGYDQSPFEGRGTLDLLLHHRRIAGYSPAFPVESQAHASGSTWTLTVTTTGYAPSGTDAADWLAAGDQIRIVERDTVAPLSLTGTVTAATATTVTVALDMSLLYALAVTLTANLLPAPGSETWTASGVTITTGIADPAGGTSAVTITDDSGAVIEFGHTNTVPYTAGNDLWLSAWIKKDLGATELAEVRIRYSTGTVARARIHPATGAVSSFATTWDALSAVDLGWGWFLAARHAGEAAATTVRAEVFPAISPAAATGSVTVYGARIADATADPDAADPTRAWRPEWGTGEWRIGYDRAPSVDEHAPAGRRWAQSDFCFVAGEDRRIGFASGDVDAIEFAP